MPAATVDASPANPASATASPRGIGPGSPTSLRPAPGANTSAHTAGSPNASVNVPPPLLGVVNSTDGGDGALPNSSRLASPSGGGLPRHLSLSASDNTPMSPAERRRRSTTASLTENFATFRRFFGARNELALRRLEHDRLVDAATSMFRMIETAIAEGTFSHSPGATTPLGGNSVTAAPPMPMSPSSAQFPGGGGGGAGPPRTQPDASDDSLVPQRGNSQHLPPRSGGGGIPPLAAVPTVAGDELTPTTDTNEHSSNLTVNIRRESSSAPQTSNTTSATIRRVSSVDIPAAPGSNMLTPMGAGRRTAAGGNGGGNDTTPLSARSNVDARVVNGSFYGNVAVGGHDDFDGGGVGTPPESARLNRTTGASGPPRAVPRGGGATTGSGGGMALTADAIRLLSGSSDLGDQPSNADADTAAALDGGAGSARMPSASPAGAATTAVVAGAPAVPLPGEFAAVGSTLIPGLRVGAASNDSLNGDDDNTARTDDSMEDTKFSRSMASSGDAADDGLFDAVNDYVLMDELGRGQTGRVMRAVHGETGMMYAIKIIPRSLVVDHRRSANNAISGELSAPTALLSASVNDNNRNATTAATNAVKFKREVKVLKGLKNKRVVRLLEVIDDPAEDQVFLVMPLLEKGPMIRFNDDRTCDVYTTETAARYVSDIAAGLAYLKRHRIVHRDLKPDNVLLTDDDRCVLVDFGQSEWGTRAAGESSSSGSDDSSDSGSSSGTSTARSGASGSSSSEVGIGRYTPQSSQGPGNNNSTSRKRHKKKNAGGAWRGNQEGRNAGTPAFMAPEVIAGAAADFPADVWALGVIIYAMLYGCLPFRSRHGGPRGQLELFEQIIHQEPEYSDEVDFMWNELIQGCLQKEPSERLLLAGIRRHPALASGGIAFGARSAASSLGSEFERSFGGVTPNDDLLLDDASVMLPVRRGKVANPNAAANTAAPAGGAGMMTGTTTNNGTVPTAALSTTTTATVGGGDGAVGGTSTLLSASTSPSGFAPRSGGGGGGVASSHPAERKYQVFDPDGAASASRRSSAESFAASANTDSKKASPSAAGTSSEPLHDRGDSLGVAANGAAPATPMLGAARTSAAVSPMPGMSLGSPQQQLHAPDRALTYLASPIHRAGQAKYRLSSGSNSGPTPSGTPARGPLDGATSMMTPIRLAGTLGNPNA